MTKDAVTKNGQDKPRVLIVEDDSAIAAGLRLNLRHEGYVVTVEADGELGLKRALQDVPDLVKSCPTQAQHLGTPLRQDWSP